MVSSHRTDWFIKGTIVISHCTDWFIKETGRLSVIARTGSLRGLDTPDRFTTMFFMVDFIWDSAFLHTNPLQKRDLL